MRADFGKIRTGKPGAPASTGRSAEKTFEASGLRMDLSGHLPETEAKQVENMFFCGETESA
jgi:hypothetical protein